MAECCRDYNSEVGNLEGYDCKLCNNRGDFLRVRDGRIVTSFCDCTEIRKSIRQIEQSGIKLLLERCTFDNYRATEKWQEHFLSKAKEYLTDYAGNWFYMGGQVGCGKTHLCTAIVGEFLSRGDAARYMLWRDEVVGLKAIVNDGEAYGKTIKPLKEVTVLYIDDFFKTENGNEPTAGDMNVAFELINHRYMNRELVTIISSEKSIDEILAVSEAVGSRIYQLTKKYCLIAGRDRTKNYRLK